MVYLYPIGWGCALHQGAAPVAKSLQVGRPADLAVLEELELVRRLAGRGPGIVDLPGQELARPVEGGEEPVVLPVPDRHDELLGQLVPAGRPLVQDLPQSGDAQQRAPESPVDMHQRTFMKTGSLGSGGSGGKPCSAIAFTIPCTTCTISVQGRMQCSSRTLTIRRPWLDTLKETSSLS